MVISYSKKSLYRGKFSKVFNSKRNIREIDLIFATILKIERAGK